MSVSRETPALFLPPHAHQLIVDVVYDYKLICNNAEKGDVRTKKAVISEISVALTNATVSPVQDIAEFIRKSANSNENDMDKIGFSWTGTPCLNEDAVAYDVKFPRGTALRYARMERGPHLKELRFKIRQTVLTTQIHIDHQDFVSWIMRALFEDKTFAISPEQVPTQWQ